MDIQEKDLIAYYGLYCEDRIRYKSKAADLARELADELKKTEFYKYAQAESSVVEELKHYKEYRKVLDTIARLQCNAPCRIGGGYSTFSCNIIECCRHKGFDGCWECAESEKCDKFEFLKPFCGDMPLQNIKTIKENGLDGWLKSRTKFYIWR